jgi:lantibiotic biosynthesis protein
MKIDMRNRNSLDIKLEEICKSLHSCRMNKIGLFTGLSGINWAANHLKWIDSELILEKNLNIIVSEIEGGFADHTFSTGISGFLWSLNHLIASEAVDKEDCDIINLFYPFLYERMMQDLSNNNWDFLHGAIGVGLLFATDQGNEESLRYTNNLIDKLEEICIRDENDAYKWKSTIYMGNYRAEGYNLGLSHGITGIIAFLTKTYKKGINQAKSKKMLEGAIKYLLQNQNDLMVQDCYFPSWIGDGNANRKSRLGWCYGDLGIAVTLYNAAKVLEDIALEEFALKVLHYNTKRRNLERNSIADAGLCHGTAGIAHIYNRMFWNTKDEIFHETAKFWFNKTLEMSKYPDGLAGFKAIHSFDADGAKNEYSLLEGIAGIGLAIHSWITDTEPTWDKFLLLS